MRGCTGIIVTNHPTTNIQMRGLIGIIRNDCQYRLMLLGAPVSSGLWVRDIGSGFVPHGKCKEVVYRLC